MKKKLALVLSVMLCLALLGGCGKTAAESSAGSSGGETSAGKSEADESTSDKSETAGKTEDQKAGMGNFLEKDKEKKLKVVPFQNK